MPTATITTTSAWQEAHDGACNIELRDGGKARIHFGAVAPAIDTDDYILIESHSRLHREDRDSYQYGYSDKVFILAEAPHTGTKVKIIS